MSLIHKLAIPHVLLTGLNSRFASWLAGHHSKEAKETNGLTWLPHSVWGDVRSQRNNNSFDILQNYILTMQTITIMKTLRCKWQIYLALAIS